MSTSTSHVTTTITTTMTRSKIVTESVPIGFYLVHKRERHRVNRQLGEPHTCQFWGTATIQACKRGPKKCLISWQNSQNGQNGPKFSIFYAKMSTVLKKVHHCRSWRLWQIWAMSIGSLLDLCWSGSLRSKNVKCSLPVGYGRKWSWQKEINLPKFIVF